MNRKRTMIRAPKKALFLKRWSKQAARERASERYPSRVPLARDFSRKPPNIVLVRRLEFKALNKNKPEFFLGKRWDASTVCKINSGTECCLNSHHLFFAVTFVRADEIPVE